MNVWDKIVAALPSLFASVAMASVRVPSYLYLIHLILMLSPAASALAIHFAVLPGDQAEAMPKDQIGIFQTVAATIAIVAVGLSQLIPRFMTGNSVGIRASGAPAVPMRKFVSMKIIQWALLESAALFVTVVFYLTRHQSMLMSLGILIALLALMRPTIDELVRYNIKE